VRDAHARDVPEPRSDAARGGPATDPIAVGWARPAPVAASILMQPDARRSTVPSIEVRPFQRRDREQLTALVNAHIEVVLPGVAVSVNAVLSQLEREPGETIVDPWAVERATLVTIVRDSVVAAAHLVRYGDDARVSDSYRAAAEIRWLVFAPGAEAAADALAARCVAAMEEWRVARMYADGALPAPGVYGVPDVWPHVGAALLRAGFAPGERVEAVLVADVAELPRGGRRRWTACASGAPSAPTRRGSRRCSTGGWPACTRSRATSRRAARYRVSPAGPTCGSCTSMSACAGAASPPGWSATPRTGFASGASSVSSTTSPAARTTRTCGS
jgi:hypothetical protein